MNQKQQKKREELLTLLNGTGQMSSDERSARIRYVESASRYFSKLQSVVAVSGRLNAMNSALALLADTRELSGQLGELLQFSRDLQYRCRRLLEPGQTQRRRRQDGLSNPGGMIREYMSTVLITLEELSVLFAIDQNYLRDVLANVAPISYRLAKLLEEATDISAEGWLAVSANYYLANTPEPVSEDVRLIQARFKRNV